MVPAAYRSLLQDGRTRRLLTGLRASSLGDGMSMVTIAWLAVRIAPASEVGRRADRRASGDDLAGPDAALVRKREATRQESRSDRPRGAIGSGASTTPIELDGSSIMKLQVTRIYVDDQEKALRFYTATSWRPPSSTAGSSLPAQLEQRKEIDQRPVPLPSHPTDAIDRGDEFRPAHPSTGHEQGASSHFDVT